jgi:hypothetical protein
MDIAHRDDRSRSGFDEIVATKRDLRRTFVGRTESGGSEAAGC